MADDRAVDARFMSRAIELAWSVRAATSPNPWVGCVVVAEGEIVGEGATSPPGGPHAEIVALGHAGPRAPGSTCYVTLEPCAHFGRTPPCTAALIAAGVRRVVVGLCDPDHNVAGAGLAQLGEAGIEVTLGQCAAEIGSQLAPYLCHRISGRPYVVLKMAATLDGRIAAPDRSSRSITGPAATEDVHRLRAESDAVLVGRTTVVVDDPELTVRLVAAANPAAGSSTCLDQAPGSLVAKPATSTRSPSTALPGRTGGSPTPGALSPWRGWTGRQPLRVVLGRVPRGARVLPALSFEGEIETLLDDLGRRGVVQLLVEGGASVAGDLHRRGLVDRYVVYLAPALFGGDDGRPLLAGPGAPSIAMLWRAGFDSVDRCGEDLRLILDGLSRPWRAGQL